MKILKACGEFVLTAMVIVALLWATGEDPRDEGTADQAETTIVSGPPIGPDEATASVSDDAGNQPVPDPTAETRAWEARFNDQVSALAKSGGWPMRVTAATAELVWEGEVTSHEFVIKLAEVGRSSRVHVLRFRNCGAEWDTDRPWTEPFTQLNTGDRVRFDQYGWPFRVCRVWVQGGRFGCKAAASPIKLPARYKEYEPIIPLD